MAVRRTRRSRYLYLSSPPYRGVMPKKSRKGGGNFAVIPDSGSIVLSTLADDTIIQQSDSITLIQDFFVLSADTEWTMRGHTAGEGPLDVGFAMGLTVSEINEKLDARPTSKFDVPAIEHARRRVRVAGAFAGLNTEEVLNDGKKIRTKLGWLIPAGQALPSPWCRNRSGGTLTTGTVILPYTKYYGYWR